MRPTKALRIARHSGNKDAAREPRKGKIPSGCCRIDSYARRFAKLRCLLQASSIALPPSFVRRLCPNG